jgi:hypothetical protein
LRAAVVDAFVRELRRSYRWRAKHLFGLSRVAEAFAGAVIVIQRLDSALVLDGVYVTSAGADEKNLTFLRLPTPTEYEVHEVFVKASTRDRRQSSCR